MSEYTPTRKKQKAPSFNINIKRPSWWIQIIIVSVTLIAIGITAFLGVQTFHASRQTALNQFNEHQLILARSAAAGIETYFSEVKASLVSATKVSTIRDMTPECLEYMQNMYLGFIPRTSIRRIDETGILRFIYPSDDWRGELRGRNYGEEPYFRKARDNDGVTLSGIITNEKGEKRIRMAAPVYGKSERDQTGRTFKGILIISFDLRSVGDIFITPIVSGETGYAWLMDQNGYFLAHNVNEFIGQDAFKVREKRNPELSYESINEIQQQVIAGREGIGRYISGWHRGEAGRIEKLIAYSPIYVINRLWSVAVVAPVSEVDRIIRTTGVQALNTFAFIILFLILAGIFSSLSVYRWSNLLRSEVRKRTKELRETTDYLNNLIRCANAPIVVLDNNGRATIFNEAFEEMSRRTEGEMIGQPLDILFPEESRPYSLQRLDRAQKGEKNLNGDEIAILTRKGHIRTGTWNSANIYSEDGNTLVATIIHGEDVTERRKVEEALRESEEQYRTVVENQTELICRYTPDWKLTFVNEAYCNYFNKKRDELVGYSFMPLIPEEQRDGVVEEHKKLLDSGIQEIRHEHQAIKDNGELSWQQWVNKGIFDDQGVLVEYQSVGRDITDIKMAEEEILISEERYRTLFEGSPDAIFLGDLETGINLDANPAACQLLMKPREEIIGTHQSLLHPPRIRKIVTERFREEDRRTLESLILRSDGTEVPVEITAQMITIKGKKVIQGIFRDITERKESEKMLRENEERFRKIFEGGALGMAFLGMDYKFDRVNATFCTMLGYNESELKTLTYLDITHPKHREIDKKQVAQLLQGQIPYYKTEKRYIRKDGEIIWGDITASVVYDESRNPLYFIAMIEDITDRKRAEEEKTQLEQQLLHAQKMEALGTLVAGVAHEINNPVNKIMFDMPLLQKVWQDAMPVLKKEAEGKPDKKYGGLTYEFLKENLPQLLSDMELAANRVAKTVSNLKNFTRQSSITDKRPMELNTAVLNAVRLIETALRKSNILLEYELAEKSPVIEGNLQSIEQIIMNIAINATQAIKHTNGKIKISTGLQKTNGQAFITISDNGKGIAPTITDKIFDPFVTTRQAEGGTGLGLPITYNLVEAHGGEITFKSKEGEGTAFTVAFPSITKTKAEGR
ncbi:MAG: PAS domain S-box protein [Deltaproteobacteria bacterium]|nr:PAS domain S-box protein [Deltaproteobacteria bacterium]MBN2845122.1 PAS domain S-box protein [Deltaproteobacteria bacterium]